MSSVSSRLSRSSHADKDGDRSAVASDDDPILLVVDSIHVLRELGLDRGERDCLHTRIVVTLTRSHSDDWLLTRPSRCDHVVLRDGPHSYWLALVSNHVRLCITLNQPQCGVRCGASYSGQTIGMQASAPWGNRYPRRP